MTSFQTIEAKSSGFNLNFGSSDLQYSFVLSLALHIGVALIVVFACGFNAGGKNTDNFSIQDVALTSSISTPAKSASASPDSYPAITSTTQTAAKATAKSVQRSSTEPSAIPSGSSENMGGPPPAPLGFGDSHGYFSSQVEDRALRGNIRGYYLEMVKKINLEWWDKAAFLKDPLRHDGIFELLLQRDGTIVSIRILQGTGSSEADRLLTETIRKALPLSPLPTAHKQDQFKTQLRIKAPPPGN